MIVARAHRVCQQSRRHFRGNLPGANQPRDIGRVLGGKKLENGKARESARGADTVASATISIVLPATPA
jgi:hypothetical protein